MINIYSTQGGFPPIIILHTEEHFTQNNLQDYTDVLLLSPSIPPAHQNKNGPPNKDLKKKKTKFNGYYAHPTRETNEKETLQN